MEPFSPDEFVWTNFSDGSAGDDSAETDWAEIYYWSDVINAISTKGIIPFGLLTNLTFLFVVIRVRAMHTAINVHLSNLAVADMLFLIIMTYKYVTQTVNFVSGVLVYLVYIASTLFVTAVAAGRCFAIFCPFRARAGPTKHCAAVVAVVVWLASLLLSVAFNVVVHAQSVPPLVPTLLYLLLHPVFLVINVVLYVCVICGLWTRQRISATSVSQRRLVFMLVTNTAVFFALHLAATTFNMYAMFNPMMLRTRYTGHALLFMLAFLNSSLNPLVYTITNAEYRAAFVTAFKCHGCRCRKGRQPTNYMAIQEMHVAQTASTVTTSGNNYNCHNLNQNTELSEIPNFTKCHNQLATV